MENLLIELKNYREINYLTDVGFKIAKEILNIFDKRSLIDDLKLSISDETNDVGICLYLNNIFVHINDDNSVDIDQVTEDNDLTDEYVQYHDQKGFNIDQINDAYIFLNNLLLAND